MPSMSQIVAGSALLITAGAWSWAFLADIAVEDPGKPRIKAEPVARLEASLPIIGPFSAFNINQENPFVPWQLRERERERINAKPTTGTKPPPPTPVVEKPVLPPLPPTGSTVPTVRGIQLFQGKATVLTIPPGEDAPRWLALGDVVGDWRLKAVDGGRTTVWTETASGQELRLIVTPAQEPEAGEEAPEDGKAAKDKIGKDAKATNEKKPTGKDAKAKDVKAKDAKAKDAKAKERHKISPPSQEAPEDQAQPAKPPPAPAPPKEQE